MWPFTKKADQRPVPPIIDPKQNGTRVYPEDTITPLRFKLILKNADLGLTTDYMELLDACANDYKVASVLRTKKLSVAAAPYTCEPMSDEPNAQDEAVCKEAQDFWDSIPNFCQFKMDLLDAHFRGFASGRAVREMVDGSLFFKALVAKQKADQEAEAEAHKQAGDGAVKAPKAEKFSVPVMREMITAWQPLESRFFTFEDGEFPKIVTVDNGEGVPLPKQYLFYACRDKPGPVTRGGTGRSVAKMWIYKGYFMIDMASYIEKYGQPHVNVTIPKSYVEGSPELERAKSAARALVADNIGLVPEGVAIELLESIKQTSNVKDVYLAAITFCDEAIAMAELGHTLTSGASTVGGLGHGGEAKQAADVKQEIKDYLAMHLEEFLNYEIGYPRHLRMWGPDVPPPWLCIDVAEEEDEVQVATANKLRAETLTILAAAGMEVSKEQCYRDFKLEKPLGPKDVMKAPAPQVPVGPDGKPIEKPAPGDKPKPKGA